MEASDRKRISLVHYCPAGVHGIIQPQETSNAVSSTALLTDVRRASL
jgi:hypothetical protein